ncbi:Nn.00g041270.m01.CDS01 [Neocucurbitaria sp. VM-36]
MTRLVSFVLSALLTLLAVVHAKSKGDQIRLYAFTSDYCYGPPAGSNVDIKRDECVDIHNGARSVKPMIDPKRSKWLDDVNKGATFCEMITYQTVGCLAGQELNSNPLPEKLHQCVHPGRPGEPISLFSVKFQCGGKPVSSTTPNTSTATLVVTSWAVGADEKPTPYYETNTVTQTRLANRNVAGQWPESSVDRLEPRDTKRNSKGVWMLHPWARSIICYECYTKKDNDFSKIDCRSGPNNAVDCGSSPVAIDGEQITLSHTAITTSTDPNTPTTTLYELTTSTLDPNDFETVSFQPLEMRSSWHRRVTFDHPFLPGTKVCADAEWEKRGQPKAEVRLQKVGADLKKCNEANAQSIDVPSPVLETVWQSTTVTKFVQATGTHTVFALPPGFLEEELSVPAHKDL